MPDLPRICLYCDPPSPGTRCNHGCTRGPIDPRPRNPDGTFVDDSVWTPDQLAELQAAREHQRRELAREGKVLDDARRS